MTIERELVIDIEANENNVYDYLKKCIFMAHNKSKNAESIWLKDDQNNIQLIIRNYLNFNSCTFLGTIDNINVSETFDKSLYEKVKVLCEVKNSR